MPLAAGALAWLHGALPADVGDCPFNLQLVGRGLKATVLVGKRLVGRIWLPSEMRPTMTGGADDRLFLPAAWLHEAGGELHLLLESVSADAELAQIHFPVDS